MKKRLCIFLYYAFVLLCIAPVHGVQRSCNSTVLSNKNYALKKVHTALMRNLALDIPSLRATFDNKIKGFKTSSRKYITIDFEHILGMDLVFLPTDSVNIKGFHHDFNNRVENSGTIKFVKKANVDFIELILYITVSI